MTLETALIDFWRGSIAPDNDWYKWRKINPRYLPEGVSVGSGNAFSQNENLKKQLSKQYQTGSDDQKIELTRYYIAVWGGVRRNSADKISAYALNQPHELIANGIVGIASWSKALSIRDPDSYAIYDARVAVSLNALQIIHNVAAPVLFPLLTGQNKIINEGAKLLAGHAGNGTWRKISPESFYDEYNALLAKVALSLNVKHYAVEMALFTKAPALLKSASLAEPTYHGTAK
jgi:hypothetical protein